MPVTSKADIRATAAHKRQTHDTAFQTAQLHKHIRHLPQQLQNKDSKSPQKNSPQICSLVQLCRCLHLLFSWLFPSHPGCCIWNKSVCGVVGSPKHCTGEESALFKGTPSRKYSPIAAGMQHHCSLLFPWPCKGCKCRQATEHRTNHLLYRVKDEEEERPRELCSKCKAHTKCMRLAKLDLRSVGKGQLKGILTPKDTGKV